MTETHEQTLPADRTVDASGEGAAPPARADKARPATKRGSLSSMLLPELQQVAGGLGISASKLRKSELIAAIETARDSSATANGAARSARTPRAAAAPRSDTAPDAARGTDTPERAQRDEPRATQAPDDGGAADGGAATSTDRRGDQPRQGNQGQSRQQANRDGGASANRDGGQYQANPNRQQGNRGDAQNRSDSQNRGDVQNRSDGQGDDDDFDGRRRGRRYRDRRGRTRDRVVGQPGAGNDAEPTISEDDVLVPVAGIVDAIEDKNSWFVRTSGYFASPEDLYVPNSFVRRFGLRRGDAITGAVRQARDGERREKFNPLVRLDTINGRDPELAKNRVEFTKLTPLYPQERLRLETEPHILTTRVIDLVMPIGKGQRALIVSPPKAGKTMVLQAIANAIATNNPEVHLMVVLIDERPEEVTDMQRSVKGEVVASTFDRRPQDHITVAELSIERAKRLVEMGHDVVVLLDSITRLGRAYNLGAPASGRILSGGVDSTALYPPKRFLGAARNIENGGSLTILATALVETGSAGDTVIFEEFKGTGNAELKLDRKIADKRVFPAVDVDQSSTRKEELLLSPDELSVTIKLRRVLHSLEQQQAIDLLLDRLKKSRTNLEFLMQIAKTTPGQE